MNRFTEQLHTEATNVRLTGAERRHILTNLRAAMEPVPSPFFIHGLFISRFAYAGLSFLLVAFTGTAYASHYALPGDILYPVKVSVAEPITGSLAFTDAAKVAWHTSIAEERLFEAEALTNSGTLDEETSIQLAQSVSVHAEAVDTIARRIGIENPISEDRIAARFSSSVAEKSTKILAAGKQSHNPIAMRASGDFVVQVSRGAAGAQDEAQELGYPTANMIAESRMADEPQAKMMTLMIASEPVVEEPETIEALSLRARDAFALASSTLATATLPDSESAQAQAQVAKLANLLVKAEAELQLGNEVEATADFTLVIAEAAEVQAFLDGAAQNENNDASSTDEEDTDES